MTISMYQVSIPRFIHMLQNLAAILDKANGHAEARKIDPATLPNARLFPDMLPLASQVRIACDAANGVATRLSGATGPTFEDDEKTLADLKTRIDKTVAFLKTVKAAQVDGTEAKELSVKVGGQDTKFSGAQFLLARAIPNFYFHVATAYGILRHNGVEIGKRDFLGNTTAS
ncbi:MAG TPA: DUF1993 domain-containing protein [Casimicrobiaceae bacterium]|nr:DUF1993 domain-containing protein [Casimicrobiaceae bacterium]